AEILVPPGDLPQEEVGVGPYSRDGVGAERLHAAGPLVDDLREGVLPGRALLHGKPPPGRVDAVEAVGDVLAVHGPDASARPVARRTVIAHTRSAMMPPVAEHERSSPAPRAEGPARVSTEPLAASRLLALQRAGGNRAVARMVAAGRSALLPARV